MVLSHETNIEGICILSEFQLIVVTYNDYADKIGFCPNDVPRGETGHSLYEICRLLLFNYVQPNSATDF